MTRYPERVIVQQHRCPDPTPSLTRVAKRLGDLDDLAQRGCVERPRLVYPLAAVVIGSAHPPASDQVIEVAAALELMDAAVIEHYYELDRPADERLLAGDYRYACGMRIVADMNQPQLVATLARATSDVAKGHSLAAERENALGLRSALWPAAVELVAALSGEPGDETRLRLARELGIGRECGLAELADAATRIEQATRSISTGVGAAVFGEEHAYLAGALASFGPR